MDSTGQCYRVGGMQLDRGSTDGTVLARKRRDEVHPEGGSQMGNRRETELLILKHTRWVMTKRSSIDSRRPPW
eukprot:scaffold310_cov335-Pavlova_lutheri.AAC.51